MEYTLRAWVDGELLYHVFGDENLKPQDIIRWHLDELPEGCEARLYRGHWHSDADIGIEHLAAEQGGDVMEDARKLATELGYISRSRLMRYLRISSEQAAVIAARLEDEAKHKL